MRDSGLLWWSVLGTKFSWDEKRLSTKVCGLDVLKRTLDILSDEIYLDDIRGALDWNRIAAAINDHIAAASTATVPPAVRETATALRQAPEEVHKRHVPIHVLAPTIWFGKDNSSTEFNSERISLAVEHRRNVACDAA
jgi:hypothetical protein